MVYDSVICFCSCSVSPVVYSKLTYPQSFGIGFSTMTIVFHHKAIIFFSEKGPRAFPLLLCIWIFRTVHHHKGSPQSRQPSFDIFFLLKFLSILDNEQIGRASCRERV